MACWDNFKNFIASYLGNKSSSLKKTDGRPCLPNSALPTTFVHLSHSIAHVKIMLEVLPAMYIFQIGPYATIIHLKPLRVYNIIFCTLVYRYEDYRGVELHCNCFIVGRSLQAPSLLRSRTGRCRRRLPLPDVCFSTTNHPPCSRVMPHMSTYLFQIASTSSLPLIADIPRLNTFVILFS